MATDITLPDMGEGIEDVTINRWLVEEGGNVDAGDIIVEVATDKVDTEVPSPVGGTVLKLNYGPGELVDISAVLAVIGEPGESVAVAAGEEINTTEPEVDTESAQEEETQLAAQESTGQENGADAPKATPVARRMAEEEGISLKALSGSGPGGQIRKDDVLSYLERQQNGEIRRPEGLPDQLADVASLSVHRLAAAYNVDLRTVAEGKALSTLTRYDVLRHVAKRDHLDYLPTAPAFPSEAPAAAERGTHVSPSEGAGLPAKAPSTQTLQTQSGAGATQSAQKQSAPAPKEVSEANEGDEFVPHNRMRTLIARNTVASAFSAPHVTTMWDVNMSAVLAHRKAHKREFASAGVNLTITAYFMQALIAGVRAVPAANATWTDDGVIVRRSINLGMAVALPADDYGLGGLIVPVIPKADDLNLMGIARRVNELAQHARDNQLSASELQGGTITLTNYGTSGSRFQTPIIVQPQVGILGVGAIEKRPVVVSQGHPLEANSGDYLTFAPMTTLGFSYDHRVLDGASADAFCAAVRETLEAWPMA